MKLLAFGDDDRVLGFVLGDHGEVVEMIVDSNIEEISLTLAKVVDLPGLDRDGYHEALCKIARERDFVRVHVETADTLPPEWLDLLHEHMPSRN